MAAVAQAAWSGRSGGHEVRVGGWIPPVRPCRAIGLARVNPPAPLIRATLRDVAKGHAVGKARRSSSGDPATDSTLRKARPGTDQSLSTLDSSDRALRIEQRGPR